MRTMIVVCSLLVALGGCSGVNISGGQGFQQLAVQGKQWLDQQRYDEATTAYREAVRRDPANAVAQYGLGVAYSRTGADDQAIAAFREAICLQPDYADAYYSLGLISTKQGQNDQALEAYRQALRLNPNHAEAYAGLGIVYIRACQDDQALEVYRQALRLNPNLPSVYYSMWGLFKLKWDASGAQRAWQAYQALVPGAGLEPSAHFAQTEMPDPSTPIAVEAVAARLPTEAPAVQTPAPVPPSNSPPPEPLRVSAMRSAEATPKPSLVIAAPEPLAAPAPRVSPSPLAAPAASPLPVPTPTARAPGTRVAVFSTSGRRTALVIGNAAYRVDPLRNTVNDGTNMARGLRACLKTWHTS